MRGWVDGLCDLGVTQNDAIYSTELRSMMRMGKEDMVMVGSLVMVILKWEDGWWERDFT